MSCLDQIVKLYCTKYLFFVLNFCGDSPIILHVIIHLHKAENVFIRIEETEIYYATLCMNVECKIMLLINSFEFSFT